MAEKSLIRLIHRSLKRSALYRDYEKAFTDATGLPLRLQHAGGWDLAHHGNINENAFCSLIADSGPACAACLEMQAKLEANTANESSSGFCPAGLCDTAVPVHARGETVAFLHTGQVFLQKPTEDGFKNAVEKFRKWKIDLDQADFRRAFFSSPVLPPIRHAAVVKLLSIFAAQLSESATRILLASVETEPPAIRAAKSWLAENFAGDCSLEIVAGAVHMNAFTFSRQFKKVTGFPFTKYLAHLRIEEARKRLQEPDTRINEVALAVGFKSLPHFNRVFRQVTGTSPTADRMSHDSRMTRQRPVAGKI